MIESGFTCARQAARFVRQAMADGADTKDFQRVLRSFNLSLKKAAVKIIYAALADLAQSDRLGRARRRSLRVNQTAAAGRRRP